MKKQPYELLPHQYADNLARKYPMFDRKLLDEGRISFNRNYSLFRAVSDTLLGRVPYWKKRGFKREITEEEINQKTEEVRIEHAREVYLAKKAGIKIKGNILRSIPDLQELADKYNWNSLSTEGIKVKESKNKKEPREKPQRDDPEDNLRERFSREDATRWY